MKKNLIHIVTAAIAACAFVVAVGLPLNAQTTLTKTTAAAAISATSTVVTVASATGVTVGNLLYIDNEIMLINAVSGVRVGVQRGYNSTNAKAHISGRTIYTGPPNAFSRGVLSGACTASSDQLYAPVIQVDNGLLAACINGYWQAISNQVVSYPSFSRTPVSDAAYTMLATDYLVAYTSLTAGRTVTLPTMTGQPPRAFILLDEAGNANTYNITVTGTINGSTSNSIATAYGVLRLWWTGSSWVKW